MIDSIQDLNLEDILKEYKERPKTEEERKIQNLEIEHKINLVLEEKLGINIPQLKQAVCDSLVQQAPILVQELARVVPYNDYDKMIEDRDQMSKFLQSEGAKVENWNLHSLNEDDKNKQLLKFVFMSTAMDDGESLQGIVFTNKSGTVRHSFVQVNI